MKLSKLQATILLSGVYIFLSFAGNIAATKIITVGRLVMDAGIIYALTFTWRDLIHKQLGKKAAITTILFSYTDSALDFRWFVQVNAQLYQLTLCHGGRRLG